MTTAPYRLPAPPAVPAPPEPGTASRAHAETSRAPDDASHAPGRRSFDGWKALAVVVSVGAVIVTVIGFIGSYSALHDLARAKGFGGFAVLFPIGVDAGIIVALGLDLWLARRGLNWPFLRPVAHLLTAATIYFNAHAGERPPGEDPVAAFMHAVLPFLFVVSVEGSRYLIMRTSGLSHSRPDGIPLYRWVLAPIRTPRLYRRMRVWGLDSYEAAVKRARDLEVYEVMLAKDHGGSAKKAPKDLQLPITMAKYGLSVEEALALPQEAEDRAQRLREAAKDRQAEEEISAHARTVRVESSKLHTGAEVDAARHEATAAAAAAEAQARATATAAERAASLEVEALDSAAAAEARAREAAADLDAARDRKAASEAAQAAHEAATNAREAERVAAETAARTAEANARKEAAEEAAQRSVRDAAEAAKRAAEVRRATAEIELRAAETEDLAKLSPRERTVRRLARMILTDHVGDAEQMPLETVMEFFGVAIGTASQYRQEAAKLITDGYRP
ncbi:DUF2637 domain-containing protein [Streptomyces erythrochromogenes]|uniref:DUF2637 domain-containing protein n=1 Tax=Streptomyces erythrochromogenes TaxID=285574 RepID=UPI00386DEE1A|nr:DUF2637 domain-containing protein [Streptomyces erythrochromogenes]